MAHNVEATSDTRVEDTPMQALLAGLIPSEAAAVYPLRRLMSLSRLEPDAAWSAFARTAMASADTTKEQHALGVAVFVVLSRSGTPRCAALCQESLDIVDSGGLTYGAAARFMHRVLEQIEIGLSADVPLERLLARLGRGLASDCPTHREQHQAGRAVAAAIGRVAADTQTAARLAGYAAACAAARSYEQAVEAQERFFDAVDGRASAPEGPVSAPPTVSA